MQTWRLEYIATLKLEIEQRLIIEIRNAEDDAARTLEVKIGDLRALMEAEIFRLTTWYEGQILIIRNSGDNNLAALTLEIEIHIQVTIDAFRDASNARIEEEKTIIRSLEITIINEYRYNMEIRVQVTKEELYIAAEWEINLYREHMIQWVIDEKLNIDAEAHYTIEVYRSQSLIIIQETIVEIDINL
jgi:hypothetical protein